MLYPEGEIAVGHQEIADVEIANEVGVGGVDIVAIAKLSVDEQAVVEKAPVDGALVFGIVPALIAGGDVGSKVPVVVLYHGVEHAAYLRGDGAGEKALHGKRGFALLARGGVGKMMNATSMGVLLPIASIGAILAPWMIGVVAQYLGLQAGMMVNLIPCIGIFVLSFILLGQTKNSADVSQR